MLVPQPLLGLILLIIGMVVSLFSYVGLMIAMEQESLSDWRAALSAPEAKYYPSSGRPFGHHRDRDRLHPFGLAGHLFLRLIHVVSIAVILEGNAAGQQLNGARNWSKGRWWHVFGRLFVAGLILGLIYMIVLGIAGIIDELYILPIVQFVLTLVITSISVAFSYQIYKHLNANPVVVAPAPAAQPMA